MEASAWLGPPAGRRRARRRAGRPSLQEGGQGAGAAAPRGKEGAGGGAPWNSGVCGSPLAGGAVRGCRVAGGRPDALARWGSASVPLGYCSKTRPKGTNRKKTALLLLGEGGGGRRDEAHKLHSPAWVALALRRAPKRRRSVNRGQIATAPRLPFGLHRKATAPRTQNGGTQKQRGAVSRAVRGAFLDQVVRSQMRCAPAAPIWAPVAFGSGCVDAASGRRHSNPTRKQKPTAYSRRPQSPDATQSVAYPGNPGLSRPAAQPQRRARAARARPRRPRTDAPGRGAISDHRHAIWDHQALLAGAPPALGHHGGLRRRPRRRRPQQRLSRRRGRGRRGGFDQLRRLLLRCSFFGGGVADDAGARLDGGRGREDCLCERRRLAHADARAAQARRRRGGCRRAVARLDRGRRHVGRGRRAAGAEARHARAGLPRRRATRGGALGGRALCKRD
ncbi:MAG: hypothetical protein J3K34DRAFT_520941 [Monoraphidium minutum]|nr:MAG: hypothetical protein J3K34DRAFT_520941 [Monoraphidium minutum]